MLICGSRIVLRDRLSSDADRYVYWQNHGEWRAYDAPWEGGTAPYPPERLAEMRARFIERCGDERPEPRTWAMIARLDGYPLGWVSSYTLEEAPDTRFVGIDLCDDAYLNRGLGTEALRLWLDYLSANTAVERLGLETWSFNPRMIRVAEKVGFVLYNVKRRGMVWQGEPLDLLQFSLLRSQWPPARVGESDAR